MPQTMTLSCFDPAAIARSGQCFRMRQTEGGAFLALCRDRSVTVAPAGEGRFTFSCGAEELPFWADYFDLAGDYAGCMARIPGEDAFLRRAAVCGGGVRILRQDPFETLISFILSQRKSIPAIRSCVEALCSRFGAALPGGLRAFPTPEALAGAGEGALRACGLGYRAPYVAQTARRVSEGEMDLAALRALPDEALCEALRTLPGVGIKVAGCVMLFAYHRLAAAPVDVWIQRVIDEEYGGASPFPRWGADAGIYQQYLFYYRQQVLRGR